MPNATVEEFREIPLTRGYVAKVSPEDYERFRGLPWFALVNGRHVYAAYKPSDSPKTYLLHRMVLDAPEESWVDHRPPGNTLDCRRSNLRVCSPSQNAWNARHPRGRSGFIGVFRSYISPILGERWSGRICANGLFHRTTTFSSPVLAAAARDVLAREHHGEFAVLNFPTPSKGDPLLCPPPRQQLA